jgi:Ca2+:H+ antiporter
MSAATRGRFSWTVWAPALGLVVLAFSWGRYPPALVAALIAVPLIGAVLAAVHHAEVVAHRVGEPFGSLVLAVAVTVIEVALILTLMLSGGSGTSTYARDTVFAAVMISANGIVGLALLVGALRHHLRPSTPRAPGRHWPRSSPWRRSPWSSPASRRPRPARSSRPRSWRSPRSAR